MQRVRSSPRRSLPAQLLTQLEASCITLILRFQRILDTEPLVSLIAVAGTKIKENQNEGKQNKKKYKGYHNYLIKCNNGSQLQCHMACLPTLPLRILREGNAGSHREWSSVGSLMCHAMRRGRADEVMLT